MTEYTFGEWLNEWFVIYKKPKPRPNAAVPVEVAIRLHVPDCLKQKKLSELRVIDIDRAISEIPPSRTQKQVYDVIVGALAKAYRLELLQKDISKLVEPVRYKVKNGSALTEEEIVEFLDRVRGHKLEYLFRFYILTGCRRHEALTLRWEDIRFDRMVIEIRGTKSYSSFRFIPISGSLDDLLRLIPRRSPWVFPYKDDYVTKIFHRFCPEHKLHDLRHTFATLCAHNNVHPSATQRMLGHSKIDTTMRIYTHVETAYIANEVKKIDFDFLRNNEKDR